MRLLLSNDDGHDAEGLEVLHEALSKLAECIVVAPTKNCSANSSALTLKTPLRPETRPNGFIEIDATPADCVNLACNGMLEEQPDRVISGINSGMNMGDDVIYSGTVAAAIEGRFLKQTPIAISMSSYEPNYYSTGARVAVELLQRFAEQSIKKGLILNVNVPDIPFEQIRGYKVTRLGRRTVSGSSIKALDPRGKPVWWIGPPGEVVDAGAGSDFEAVANQYVSVTPLQLDMTDYQQMGNLSQVLEVE